MCALLSTEGLIPFCTAVSATGGELGEVDREELVDFLEVTFMVRLCLLWSSGAVGCVPKPVPEEIRHWSNGKTKKVCQRTGYTCS